MSKKDANWWREECNYISRVMDKGGRVKEMNNSPATFRRYCEMQRDAAAKDGFYDAETYIQHVIDDLPAPRKGNPTPRLKRADQPSQRARTTPKGTTTKKASERLKRRRALTHYEKTPGVWANPLVRVKVGSPSKATKAPPSARLKKRRKITQKAPEGFYANPAPRASSEIRVKAKKPRDKGFRIVAKFPGGEVGRGFALAYARALHNAHPTWAIEVEK